MIACFLAHDESTDVTDIAQLFLFIWGVIAEFKLTDKFGGVTYDDSNHNSKIQLSLQVF